MRPRSGLRRVREGQSRGVNDPVVADEGHGDLGGLPDPLPTAAERRDVGHYAQHGLLTTVHSLAFHVAEPDAKVRAEVLAGQFEHGHIATAVQLKRREKRSIQLAMLV